MYDASTANILGTSTASSGTLTATYLATGPFYLRLAGNASVTITSVSVKEIAGNHRYQTTTGSKPILRGSPVGSNLVTNGDFASGTGWTAGAGWAIGSGVATATASSGTLTSTLTATASKSYLIAYTVTRTAGSVQVSFGGRNGISRSASGAYIEYLDNTLNTNALVFTGTTFDGTIDNVTIFDVSADAVTAPYALHMDGIDDFLTTAAVDFTATDKMAVVMGVRKLSDGGNGTAVELSASADANNGAFFLRAPSGGVNNYQLLARGSVNVTATASGITAPNTSVIGNVVDIVGDSTTIRINGVVANQTLSDLGTGNFRNDALYFGRRAGTSLPFNGLDFGGICIGKTLTASQLSSAERWTAIRTGVTL
jgi:hypothetical protein